MLLKNNSQKKKVINKRKTFKGKNIESLTNFKKLIQKGSGRSGKTAQFRTALAKKALTNEHLSQTNHAIPKTKKTELIQFDSSTKANNLFNELKKRTGKNSNQLSKKSIKILQIDCNENSYIQIQISLYNS